MKNTILDKKCYCKITLKPNISITNDKASIEMNIGQTKVSFPALRAFSSLTVKIYHQSKIRELSLIWSRMANMFEQKMTGRQNEHWKPSTHRFGPFQNLFLSLLTSDNVEGEKVKEIDYNLPYPIKFKHFATCEWQLSQNKLCILPL